MIFMLDSAYAPTLGNAQQAAKDGVRLWGGYVPGGRVYHAWSRQDFDVIRQAGIRPVFIHVGTDGNEAKNNAWQCGAMTGDIVALDVEAGWNDTYSAAWASTVHAAGFVTWLYGLGSEVAAHGSPFDGTWTAAYTYPTVPTPSAKNSFQYWNSHTEYGTGCDRSVCDDHWFTPQEDTMNLDIARSIVFVRLSGEGVLTDQAQVDAYAAPMAAIGANPEASLTQLNTDLAANPNTLTARVKVLEGKVAAQPSPAPPDDDTALTARVSALETKLGNVRNAL